MNIIPKNCKVNKVTKNKVNVRKAAGPDGITGRVLRSCADQLAGLFTSIFNESFATSVVPTSFKKSVIIPVPKNSKPSCLNDYHPVALTSTVMKVFERLLKKHICSSIPATLDPLQFAYRPNRSTDDAISQVLHSSLTHIDSKMATMSGCYSLTIAQLSTL